MAAVTSTTNPLPNALVLAILIQPVVITIPPPLSPMSPAPTAVF